MTTEQVNKWWREIQALKEGKKIESYDPLRQKWIETADPLFYLTRLYRVKPEPLEVWGAVYRNQEEKDYIAFVGPACDMIKADYPHAVRICKLREVVE